jgi:hypothetical protein
MYLALMVLVVPFITDCSSNPTDPIGDISSSATLYWSRDLQQDTLGSNGYSANFRKMLVVTSFGIVTNIWDSGDFALAGLTKEQGLKINVIKLSVSYYF